MNYLLKVRRQKGMTQQAVEDITGIDTATLSLYENGLRTPSVENAKKLSSALDFDWVKLYEDDDED